MNCHQTYWKENRKSELWTTSSDCTTAIKEESTNTHLTISTLLICLRITRGSYNCEPHEHSLEPWIQDCKAVDSLLCSYSCEPHEHSATMDHQRDKGEWIMDELFQLHHRNQRRFDQHTSALLHTCKSALEMRSTVTAHYLNKGNARSPFVSTKCMQQFSLQTADKTKRFEASTWIHYRLTS